MSAAESLEGCVVPREHDSFSEVFSDALRGVPCTVHGIAPGDRGEIMPVHDWLRPANHSDRALLSHCRGATLDIGCGPGRMSAHLALHGHPVLGVDIVREAVEQSRRRGVPAIRRDVFRPMPGEGSWDTVLLADGNIGIGGAPAQAAEPRRRAAGPRPDAWSATWLPRAPGSACTRRASPPSTAGPARFPGPGSAPTRSSRSPRTSASRSSTWGRCTGAGSRCCRREAPADPHRGVVHLAAARRWTHGTGRHLARDRLRAVLPDRAVQPLVLPRRRPALPAGAPGLGLPGDPGRARALRHRGRSRCCSSSCGASTRSCSARFRSAGCGRCC